MKLGIDHLRPYEKFPIFFQTGRVVGRGNASRQFSREEWMEAQQYVLKNCDEVHPFIE